MTSGRNNEGNLDPLGTIWASPCRWGSVVVAYKKNKFQKHNLAPIEGKFPWLMLLERLLALY